MLINKIMAIEKGIIKVVWIGRNPDRIFSKMFESLKDAQKFTKKKRNFLIFKLLKEKKMMQFEWKILPYGKAKIYLGLLKRL